MSQKCHERNPHLRNHNMNSTDDSHYYIVPDVGFSLNQIQQEFDDLSASRVSDLEVESDFVPRHVEVEEDDREIPEWLNEMGEEDWASVLPTDSNESSLSSSPTHTVSYAELLASDQQPAACERQKRHYRKKTVNHSTRWSAQEQAIFVSGLNCLRGRDGASRLGPGVARMLSEMIGSRTAAQVRSHAQKYFKRLRQMRME